MAMGDDEEGCGRGLVVANAGRVRGQRWAGTRTRAGGWAADEAGRRRGWAVDEAGGIGCGRTTAAACAVPQEEEEVRQDKRSD